MKLLAIGDMHLGRAPSRLPPELAARTRELGPAEAWRIAVGVAIAAGVKAVLLAGDVVEKEDDFFEAYRELSQGVRRLTDKGIKVIGVAGNHDVRVLPRLAEQIPQFRLLGRGGEWERHEIREDNEVVSLWGWSFPQAKVPYSPLHNALLARGAGVNLGLLHCDKGVVQSPYAPVAGSELDQAGLDGWLLGHIHKPDKLAARSSNGYFSPNGYLGSLTGLDKGETGPRGPWLITLAQGRIAEVEHLPLAPLRWEHLEVPLDDLNAASEAQDRLVREVTEFDEKLGQQGRALAGAPMLGEQTCRPAVVGLRVRFTGRTRFGVAAANAIPEDDRGQVHTGNGDVHYFIESIQSDTRPEIDLQELAQRQDPVGLLAQRLLWLEQPAEAEGAKGRVEQGERNAAAEQRAKLIEAAKKGLDAQAGHHRWNSLRPTTPDPVEWLRKSGLRALVMLLAQEGENP